VLVLRPEGAAAEAASSPHRVVELEQKVAALRQENGRLAGQLAKSKGVTVESVLERIGRLKSASMAATFSPGTVADLVTDLKGLGDDGVRAVVGLLGSSDANQRFFAAYLLEHLNSKLAIPDLRKVALEDKEKMPSVMAGHALALMDDPSTVPALREIVAAKKNWESEVNALWGLCKHGDQKAIADALAFMKDPKRTKDMRLGLGANIMMLSDPELMPIVDETLRQYESQEHVATLAVNYYKTSGTADGRARLEAMAANPKLPESVRKEAREALAK
jgi:HEAT repeat protein